MNNIIMIIDYIMYLLMKTIYFMSIAKIFVYIYLFNDYELFMSTIYYIHIRNIIRVYCSTISLGYIFFLLYAMRHIYENARYLFVHIYIIILYTRVFKLQLPIMMRTTNYIHVFNVNIIFIIFAKRNSDHSVYNILIIKYFVI